MIVARHPIGFFDAGALAPPPRRSLIALIVQRWRRRLARLARPSSSAGGARPFPGADLSDRSRP